MGEELNNNKSITAITSITIRGIVNLARELDIKKEDIVTLVKEGNEFILIYYGKRS